MKELKLIATHDNEEIGAQVAKILGTKLLKYKLKTDSIGETDVELLDSVRNADVYIMAGYTADTNNALMELFILIQACKLGSANRIVTILPYFPYSKLCKTKSKRKPIPAKLIAQFLEISGTNHTVVLDLHAPQIHAFFNTPIDNLLSRPFIVKYINEKILFDKKNMDLIRRSSTSELVDYAFNNENFVILSKNPGGAKICTDIAHALKLDFALIYPQYQINNDNESELDSSCQPYDFNKLVDGATASSVHVTDSTAANPILRVKTPVNLAIIGNITNRTVIIIDDLMSSAGSWIRAANCAKAAGGKYVYCIAIHGTLGEEDAQKLYDCDDINKIYLTNTIPVSATVSKFMPKIEILDIAPLFGEAIRRIYNGESLSFLYNNVPF